MTMLRPLEVNPAVWATATSKPSVLTGARSVDSFCAVGGRGRRRRPERTMSVALFAGRPLSAAVTVPKLVSPSPGTLVWTCSHLGVGPEDRLGLDRPVQDGGRARAGRRRDRHLQELLRAGVDELGRAAAGRSPSRRAKRTVAIARIAPLGGPVAEGELDRGGVGADPERVLRLAVLVDVELDLAR